MTGRRKVRAGDAEELFKRLRALANDLPPDHEMHRLLLNLDDPANDENAKDRYTALVAGGAVDEALRLAIARQGSLPTKFREDFNGRIRQARALGLVSADEEIELDKLRLVRNIFAHSLAPIGFDHPDIAESTKGLWAHPISSWAGYFAPTFAARHQYAIVCGEFYKRLVQVDASDE